MKEKTSMQIKFMTIHSSVIQLYWGQMAKPKDLRDNFSNLTEQPKTLLKTTSGSWNSHICIFQLHTTVSFSGQTCSSPRENWHQTLKRTCSRPETNPHQTCPAHCQGQGWHACQLTALRPRWSDSKGGTSFADYV